MIYDLASALIKFDGSDFDSNNYRLLKEFYDCDSVFSLLKCGRQIGKSFGICVNQLLKATLRKYNEKGFRCLTIFPQRSQAKKFSTLYVDKIFRNNPIFQSRKNSLCVWEVFIKEFSNNSILQYSYVGDDATRLRGTSVDELHTDEFQDIDLTQWEIAKKCTSASKNPKFKMTGTPLGYDNSIEIKWQESNKKEPVIKCSRCNYENFSLIPDVYKMLQPEGLCCQKCKKILSDKDIYSAYFIAMNPQEKFFQGWHIPQIFVKSNLEKLKWDLIMYDFQHMSEFQFATEVLGISFDGGGTPTNESKLQSNCLTRSMNDPINLKNYTCTVMGVDWGFASKTSFTVVTVLGLRKDNKYEVLFCKKYQCRDRLLEILPNLIKLFKDYKCSGIGCDTGCGLTDNSFLKLHLGYERVYPYTYNGVGKIIHYVPDLGEYIVNKTKTLNLLFVDLNYGKIKFPKKEEMKPFFDDILSVKEDVRSTPYGDKKIYCKTIGTPDDFLQSLNYSILTIKLLTKDSIFDTIYSEEGVINYDQIK